MFPVADSSVPITAGSGTNIDTRTAGNGDHRQVVVLGNDGDNVASVADGGVGVNGGGITSTTGAIAAAATGTVGPLDVSSAGNVSFIIKNTVAASAWAGAPVVVFEQSDDNVSWSPLPVVRNDTGQYASTFTLGPGVASGALIFECGLESVNYVRARVTTGPTTNGFTIDIQSGGMSFAQGSTVLAVPTDGAKPTTTASVGVQATFAPHLTQNYLQPWFALQNPAASVKAYRIIRVHVELTLATTAAMLQVYFLRSILLSTGGTTSGGGSGIHDPGDGTTSQLGEAGVSTPVVNCYSAAPTALGTPSAVVMASRRIWTPLATTASSPAVLEVIWGNRPGKAPLLRPGHQFGLAWATTPGTAVAANVEVEFTEEPI